MDSYVSGDRPVIEVRTYRAGEGQRERLMTLMRELAFPIQQRLGIRLLGPFPALDDKWLSRLPSPSS